ncbi:hypothetical protein P3S68_022562 [Capsicum galapagoense]
MVVGFDSKIMLSDITGMLALYSPETQTTECTYIAGTRYSFYYDIYEESLVLLDKGELLPPPDLSSEESTDDDNDDDNDDDEENIVRRETPHMREFQKHRVMYQRVAAFLGARNNN